MQLQAGYFLPLLVFFSCKKVAIRKKDIEELKSIDSLLALKVSLGGVEKKEFPVHSNYVSVVTMINDLLCLFYDIGVD